VRNVDKAVVAAEEEGDTVVAAEAIEAKAGTRARRPEVVRWKRLAGKRRNRLHCTTADYAQKYMYGMCWVEVILPLEQSWMETLAWTDAQTRMYSSLLARYEGCYLLFILLVQ